MEISRAVRSGVPLRGVGTVAGRLAASLSEGRVGAERRRAGSSADGGGRARP